MSAPPLPRLGLIFALLLLAGATLFAEPYRHQPTGITLPDRIGLLARQAEIHDYEPSHPGLGVSAAYNAPGVTVTLYLYTLGLRAIPDDLRSELLQKQLHQAASDIVRIGELGHYSRVKKLGEGEVAWADHPEATRSLHARFSYIQQDKRRLSDLYLLGVQNHFLKIRFTCDAQVEDEAIEVRRLLLQTLDKILTDLRQSTPPATTPSAPALQAASAP